VTRDIRVTLVFDPFGIWAEAADPVRDVREELEAFRQIEDLLRRDRRFETVTPKTFLVHAECWEHFQSYRGVCGVSFQEVTPRRQLGERLAGKLPDWLTDQRILDWRLLQRAAPHGPVEDWPNAVTECLAPELNEADSLGAWLACAAAADVPPSIKDCPAVMERFRESFLGLAERGGMTNETRQQIAADLGERLDLATFAAEWLRRRALLPLADVSSQNPLRVPGLYVGSPHQRALARYLPLVFPLPPSLHAEVSATTRQAVHNARIEHPEAFEPVALRLEALWAGLAEELKTWLAMHPRAMSRAAADHLRHLPGFEKDDLARRLVHDYAPAERLPVWPGLDDTAAFDAWIAAYARFLRSSFLRRDLLQGEEDPAEGFGRWLKDHETVSFAHPERSYNVVARRVQSSLGKGRAVILVLIDALAIQVASSLADYVTDRLRSEPSWISYLFAPVPTITAVCKEAVLTGTTPDRACGNLFQALLRAYRLDTSELQVSASWEDAERTALRPNTRLLVHRDNRLDDRLHETASYSSLLEDCVGLFARTAALLARWVDDFRCIHQSPPVVLLTADHGFTYGPPPGPSADGGQSVGTTPRCVEIDGDVCRAEPMDASLTVLDRLRFHLPKSFLAARGRQFGSDTASRWTLAHGGLLPEEVVIPVLEWFGDEDLVRWPNVAFPDGAECDRNRWLLPVVLTNPYSRPLRAGAIAVGVSGSGRTEERGFPQLEAGAEHRLSFQLAGGNLPDGEKLGVDVTIRIHASRGRGESSQTRQYLVGRAKRLVERTVEQDDFEAMF